MWNKGRAGDPDCHLSGFSSWSYAIMLRVNERWPNGPPCELSPPPLCADVSSNRKMMEVCGEAENRLASELMKHELQIEKDVLDPLSQLAEVRTPSFPFYPFACVRISVWFCVKLELLRKSCMKGPVVHIVLVGWANCGLPPVEFNNTKFSKEVRELHILCLLPEQLRCTCYCTCYSFVTSVCGCDIFVRCGL